MKEIKIKLNGKSVLLALAIFGLYYVWKHTKAVKKTNNYVVIHKFITGSQSGYPHYYIAVKYDNGDVDDFECTPQSYFTNYKLGTKYINYSYELNWK